jgi:hypothetical protein
MRKRDTSPGLPRSSYSRVLIAGLFTVAALAAPVFGAEGVNPYARAIDTLADQLATRFVDPATGRRYADMLHAKLAAGEYDRVGDAAALAQRLTQDLQAVAADGHLRVDVASAVDASRGPGSGGPRRVERVPSQAAAPAPVDPPSVAETRWIAEGVAYIRFNQFAGEPASVAAVQAFVDDYATAKAIVVDTRTLLRGGGMAEMDALFPHLFDRQTVLVEMATARHGASGGGPRLAAGNTLREVAGPAGLLVLQHVAIPSATDHRLAKAKVFYLTSKRTRSAGEHFALALQRTHRGTLIGERTAGANHFGGFEPIGAGLVAFIPVGRTYDPDTGKDWEGTGIVPDVEVPADQALDKALALAKE